MPPPPPPRKASSRSGGCSQMGLAGKPGSRTIGRVSRAGHPGRLPSVQDGISQLPKRNAWGSALGDPDAAVCSAQLSLGAGRSYPGAKSGANGESRCRCGHSGSLRGGMDGIPARSLSRGDRRKRRQREDRLRRGRKHWGGGTGRPCAGGGALRAAAPQASGGLTERGTFELLEGKEPDSEAHVLGSPAGRGAAKGWSPPAHPLCSNGYRLPCRILTAVFVPQRGVVSMLTHVSFPCRGVSAFPSQVL